MSKKFTDIPIGIRRPGEVSKSKTEKPTIAVEGDIDKALKEYSKRTGLDLVITSGYRGKSHKLYNPKSLHSQKGKARDVSIKNLNKDQQLRLSKYMENKGFRVIDETTRKGAPHLHFSTSKRKSGIWNDSKKSVDKHPLKKDIDSMELPKKEKEQNVIDHLMSPLEKTINKKYPISRKPASEPVSEAPKPQIPLQEEPLDKMQLDAAEKSPALQQTPPEVKEQAKKELENPQEQERIKEQSKVGGNVRPMDQLKEALMYFGPQIAATLLVGPEAGAETGKLMEGYRAHLKSQEELALKRESLEAQQGRNIEKDKLAQESLNLRKANLAARIADLGEQRKRTENLEEDRELRREKAKTERVLQLQNYFGKRKDVQDLVKQRDLLNEMDNIIEGAPEIAAGVIDFKIAKGIAGEVGNLTSEERASAQISPSFYRKLKRYGAKALTGRLPEEDVKELRKVTKALRARTGNNFKDKIKQFATGRKLYADPEAFQKALMDEHGFGEEPIKKTRSAYEEAINNAKSLEEIEKIKQYFGAK